MATFFPGESHTFSEYLLVPGYSSSQCIPNNVSLKTPLTRFKRGEKPAITLNIPMVSAIMQSVSGEKLAIALAKQGGVSFIYGSQSIENEAAMVRRVKSYKAGYVVSDSNLAPTATLHDVLELKARTGHSTIAITADGTPHGKLMGIVASRDYRVNHTPDDASVTTFMTPIEKLVTAPENTSLHDCNNIIWDNKINTLPLVDAEGNLKYFVFRKDYDSHKKNVNELLDANKSYVVGAGINTRDYAQRVPALVEAGVDVLCIDSSEGYSEWQSRTIAWIREHYGDTVKVGQLIGEQAGFISAPVHSSVSGTVIAVEPHTHPNKGPGIMSVVIKNDGKNTLHESVVPNKPLEELTPDEIVEIVKEKGIVGMGGATFPTYVKLKPGKPIDAVLINGSECEPYLTADHRVMLEFADDIVFGLRAMMKAVSAPEGVILIEDNKPDAIALMEEKVAPYDNIRVCAAKTQYPEGAEKMLIKKVMGRQVPSGKLPADVGCVVSNTSTAKAISDAIQKGLPLVERVVSVTGEFIRNPGNYIVKLGTNVQEIIDHCGGITGDDMVLKMGGPMMGAPIKDTNVPIIKGSNGIIAIAADHTEEKECIKCGRCMDVCPMELAPLDIYKYAQLGDAETLLKLNVMDCFSCKCCEYICSSKIPLVSKINAAKGLVMPLLKKK